MDNFISLTKAVIEFWKKKNWGYLARENKKVSQLFYPLDILKLKNKIFFVGVNENLTTFLYTFD